MNTANFAEPKKDDKDCCVQCGKVVGKNPLYIEIIKGGIIRVQDGTKYDSNSDSGYMGYWAVGVECAKQLDSNLLVKEAK